MSTREIIERITMTEEMLPRAKWSMTHNTAAYKSYVGTVDDKERFSLTESFDGHTALVSFYATDDMGVVTTTKLVMPSNLVPLAFRLAEEQTTRDAASP